MPHKIPYYKKDDGYYWHWAPVNLTGACKIVSGGPTPPDQTPKKCVKKYYQAENKYFFGCITHKWWISENDIKFFDEIEIEIKQCENIND